jgi:CheY-like chemotaxis protein
MQSKIDGSGLILLVEDREDDAILLKLALKAAGFVNPIHVAHDGEEATEYISGEGDYADRENAPLPSVILLDIMMPKIDGYEFLTWLRAQPAGKNIPVIVLDSEEPKRMRHAAALGATACVSKSPEPQKLAAALKHVLAAYIQQNGAPSQ